MKFRKFKPKEGVVRMDSQESHDELAREKRAFGKFVDKKVTITVDSEDMLGKRKNKMHGRIKNVKEVNGVPRFPFIKKGSRSSGYYLTLGLLDSFASTLTVSEIKTGWI